MNGKRLKTVLFAALVCSFPLVAISQDTDGEGMPDWLEYSYACVDSAVGDSVPAGIKTEKKSCSW
jgi:hypothetical protein